MPHLCNLYPGIEGPLSQLHLRAGIPQCLGLMPDDLSWSFVIIEVKCTISVMHLNHPETLLCPASVEQLYSMNLVPGDKMVGELLT